MKNDFLTNEICEMKILKQEERFEKLHQFLLNKDQNTLILLDSDFRDGRFYGSMFSKIILNGVTIIYEQTVTVGNAQKILDKVCYQNKKQEYAGIFIEKTGKFYDEPYSLLKSFYGKEHLKPEWLGGNISEFQAEFKKKCEEKIQKELLEMYKTTEDIPDSLFSNPINEESVKNMGWEECWFKWTEYYLKNEKINFVFEIRNYEDQEISRADAIDYIIDPEGSVNEFAAKYDKTNALNKLKRYYLAQKALAEFVPSNLDVIKKDIYQAINSVKDSVKNVRLYIMGRDKNRARRMEKSIESVIIECMYPTDKFIFWDKDYLSTYSSTSWSIKTKDRQYHEPLNKIYFEDIVKITTNRTVLYEKK